MEGNLKFFTNEPERDLYSKFQTLLRGEINFFDVIVGYFRTSGFFKMCNALTEVEKIRILVGLNVDKRIVQLLEMNITPTFKIPINFEMFQAYTKFLKNIFGFIVDGVIEKMFSFNKKIADYVDEDGNPFYYRTSGGRYFNVVTDYPTGSSKERPYHVNKKFTKIIAAVLSTNLFWFY